MGKMKILFGILILVLAIVFFGWYFIFRGGGGSGGVKQPAIQIKHHSEQFNNSVTATLNAYFDMKAAFVEADSARAKDACKRMLKLADSINLTELKKDTAGIFLSDSLMLENVKSNAKSLLNQTDLVEMRKDFSMVNENLYPFLKGINYKGQSLYWQNCPMAFGEEKSASWISNTAEIINPYLGKFHPVYNGSMLNCGTVLDSIKTQ